MNQGDRDLLRVFQTTLERVDARSGEHAVALEKLVGRVDNIERRITGNGSGVGIDDRLEKLEQHEDEVKQYIHSHTLETEAVKISLEKILKRPRSVWLLGKDVGLFVISAGTFAKLMGWW